MISWRRALGATQVEQGLCRKEERRALGGQRPGGRGEPAWNGGAVCVCKCAHICGCMCVCLHVYMCMCLYMYAHTYVWQDQY